MSNIKNNNQYIKILSEHPEAVMIHRGGTVLFVNDKITALLGYSPDEMTGGKITDFLSKSAGEKIITNIKKRGIFNGEGIEIEALCKNGRPRFVSVRSSIINFNSKKSILSTINDISEKKNYEDILKYSENKFKSLFDALNEAIFIVETETGIIIDANKRAESMLKTSKKEIVGLHYSKLHPDGEFDDYIKKIEYSSGAGPAFYKKVAASDGSFAEVEISSSVVELAPGVKVFQGIFCDITDRKRKEEQLKNSLHEKEVLLKEVHHRVKNNLQIISSLLNMQLKNIGDEKYSNIIKDALGRVKSIALIHEKLYKADSLAKINFSEYIREIITYISRYYFNESCEVNFHYAIENITLDLDRSISLSLIVNEIVTNSLKYAFGGMEKGNIFVSFNRDADGCYNLILSDDGRGFKVMPDLSSLSSFGIRLAFDLIKEIGGSAEITNDPGASYKIRFK